MFDALNLEPPDWYELFQKKSLVDALLDRLQHHCITIRINGPSLRSPEPPPGSNEPPAQREVATVNQSKSSPRRGQAQTTEPQS